MWLWWVVSLIILVASIALALYIYYSSYKTTPRQKEALARKTYTPQFKFFSVTKQQVIASLKLKLQAVENNSALYYNELKKLQARIQTIEKNSYSAKPENKNSAFDENWEELYYETHEQKEKLENELDALTQAMEKAALQLDEATAKEKSLIENQSALESELNRAYELQNKIGDLQRKLQGAAERESNLKKELEDLKHLKEDYDLLQQQYAHLQSEADELQNRMIEMKNQDILSKQKINRLTELESTIEVSEYEKMDIRKSIEDIIIENEALAAKLQELQEKLNSEKYA